MTERDYLVVPYAEKDEARQAGAKWDRVAKKWYAPADVPSDAIARWWAPLTSVSASESVSSEFAAALAAAGLRVPERPPMDGKLRRVPVEGDRAGQRSGAYVGFSDDHPAGYIQNFKTGFAGSWKSQQPMPALSAEERARLLREADEKQRGREKEREGRQLAAAATLERRFAEQPTAGDHAYLTAKGVSDEAARAAARGELRADAEGSLLIPMRDIDGKFWSLQHIGADGMKGFARDGRIEGTHALLLPGSQLAVKPTDALLVVEGYATGLSVIRATALPVAVAFSGHNLKAVASAYRARHGESFPIVIAGDNDHRKPLEIGPNGRPKRNDGKVLAEEAAKAVGGYALLPDFKQGDSGTDWNDLERAHGSELLRAALALGIERARQHIGSVPFEAGRDELAEARVPLLPARHREHDGIVVRGEEAQAPSQDAAAAADKFAALRPTVDPQPAQQAPTIERPRRRRAR